jgi:hypothetical protein
VAGCFALLTVSLVCLRAHNFDKSVVEIVGLGKDGDFTIDDPTGCTALIRAEVVDPSVATVTPTGPISAQKLKFTVTSRKVGETQITIRWANGESGGMTDKDREP